jgi:hypothetical protein
MLHPFTTIPERCGSKAGFEGSSGHRRAGISERGFGWMVKDLWPFGSQSRGAGSCNVHRDGYIQPFFGEIDGLGSLE